MEGNVRAAESLPVKPAQLLLRMENRVSLAECDQLLKKSRNLAVCGSFSPADSAFRVVERIGIVVAVLRIAELISRIEKRDSLGQKYIGERVFDLLLP